MVTEETRLKEKIRSLLREVPDLWFTAHPGSRFGERGVPDFLGCYAGRMFWIEAKAPDGVVSLLQGRQIRLLQKSGAYGAVAKNIETVQLLLAHIEAAIIQEGLRTEHSRKKGGTDA